MTEEAMVPAGHRLAALAVVSSDAARRVAWRLTRRDLPIPWMTALDARAIAHIVRRVDPVNVLEWGSGNSTWRFPGEAPHLRRWVSVEHDAAWHERTAGRVRDRRVELALVPPAGGSFEGYVAYPGGLGIAFDLAIVDGMARLDCLRASRGVLSPRGVVVLHDAHLYDYSGVVEAFDHSVELEDPRNGFRVLVAGATVDPREVLDMAHLEALYSAVGDLHGRLARALGRAYLSLTF